MAVGAFDRAILMRDACIIARWPHPIMRTEVLVSPRQILTGVSVEIAKGGG